MFWYGKHRTLAYLSDLFAFRTAALIEQTASPDEGAALQRAHRDGGKPASYAYHVVWLGPVAVVPLSKAGPNRGHGRGNGQLS